jgi:hypothetical protein
MSKHTEGPWKTLEGNGFTAIGPVPTDDDVAYLLGRPTLEERRANGTLIAAAPDFFAACEGPGEDVTPLEWLAALLTDLGESGYPGTTEDPAAAWDALTHCGRLLDNLRTATQKAKGGENA